MSEDSVSSECIRDKCLTLRCLGYGDRIGMVFISDICSEKRSWICNIPFELALITIRTYNLKCPFFHRALMHTRGDDVRTCPHIWTLHNHCRAKLVSHAFTKHKVLANSYKTLQLPLPCQCTEACCKLSLQAKLQCYIWLACVRLHLQLLPDRFIMLATNNKKNVPRYFVGLCGNSQISKQVFA